MSVLINFLVLMTLLFGGLAQTAKLPPRIAWSIAIGCAVVAMSLAIVRYARSRKKWPPAAGRPRPACFSPVD